MGSHFSTGEGGSSTILDGQMKARDDIDLLKRASLRAKGLCRDHWDFVQDNTPVDTAKESCPPPPPQKGGGGSSPGPPASCVRCKKPVFGLRGSQVL